EHLAYLFDRFYRADTARARARGGTGLGLAIARAIVRGHGGEIAVSSIRGEGSAFTVTLPADPARNPVSSRSLSAPIGTEARRNEGGSS
ncbi:MAG: ATP-binding protein, partial [Thermomicrobiales bacterium]